MNYINNILINIVMNQTFQSSNQLPEECDSTDPAHQISIQTLYDLILNSSYHLKYFINNMNLYNKNDKTVLFSTLMCYEDEDPEIFDEFENIFDSNDKNKHNNHIIKELEENNFGHKWNRRFQCFSKFNHGIQMDIESWYSVTLEVYFG